MNINNIKISDFFFFHFYPENNYVKQKKLFKKFFCVVKYHEFEKIAEQLRDFFHSRVTMILRSKT